MKKNYEIFLLPHLESEDSKSQDNSSGDSSSNNDSINIIEHTDLRYCQFQLLFKNLSFRGSHHAQRDAFKQGEEPQQDKVDRDLPRIISYFISIWEKVSNIKLTLWGFWHKPWESSLPLPGPPNPTSSTCGWLQTVWREILSTWSNSSQTYTLSHLSVMYWSSSWNWEEWFLSRTTCS